MPRATDATLLATLDGADAFPVDLYTFSLPTGVARYTSDADPFSFGGLTWDPAVIECDEGRGASGVEVSTLDLVVHVEGWVLLAANGDLDNVEVKIQRAYLPEPGAAASMLSTLFAGAVCDMSATPTGARLTVKSYLYLGESDCPPRVVGPDCPWRFGGAECGVNLATWTNELVTAAGSTTTVVKTTGGYLANAIPGSVIEFATGPLAGLRRTVRSVSTNDLALTRPLPSAPAAGLGVYVTKGCPHTLAACGGFGAKARYGGFPHVPRRG